MTAPSPDQRYLNLLLDPLYACANYKPKFGTDEEEGVSLDQFKSMYGQDPFYHWIGLDSELMYAAHKAVGGMTSTYAFFRKIVGFELDAFFQLNAEAMRNRCKKVLQALLTPG